MCSNDFPYKLEHIVRFGTRDSKLDFVFKSKKSWVPYEKNMFGTLDSNED